MLKIKGPVNGLGDRLRLVVVKGYRNCVNFTLRFWRWVLYGRMPEKPASILVFRIGSLGDSICAIPAIAQLRRQYPNAKLDILTNAGAKNLVSMQKLLHPGQYNEIIDYYGYSIAELTKIIREKKYEAVIELTQYDSSFFRLLRNMVFFRLKTGINKGCGWQLDNVSWFKKTQHKYIQFEDERTRLLTILEKQTGVKPSPMVFPLQEEPADSEKVSQWLQEQGIDLRKGFIAVVPGAKRPNNTWPEAGFAEVVKHFAPSIPVVLCGGPDEKELGARLASIHPDIYNACGVFAPVQTGVVFSKSILVITNDTGPLHLSYAFGKPSVSIFSNRDYANRWFPPLNGINKVLRAENISCAPCFLEACPFDNKCTRAISSSEVIEAAETILNKLKP
jgi:ADP-heptose:LPS heptosyltransferase